ncbi:hypothetical protein SE959_06415 [Escherichia coli]|nr:hypothetical protein [Escherichia coli]
MFFQRRRFIPAGAGNTPKEIASQLNLPVYPRWRGEHKIHIDKHRVCIGLSPLAREHLTAFDARKSAAVYPRWRGEHSKHNLLLINDF